MLFHLKKKKRVKVRITKYKKDNTGLDHGFNVGKKKAVTTVFSRKFWQYNKKKLTCVQISINVCQISIITLQKSSYSILLQKMCCRRGATLI